MECLFQNLYKYRQISPRHQLENYVTEIFSYCLQTDLSFRDSFLEFIGCHKSCKTFSCKTQTLQKEFGKPDLIIRLDEHTLIVIECKIGSSQGLGQLKNYANFIESQHYNNKHFVFLTKHHEEVEDFGPSLNFKHLKWYDIYDLLKHSNNIISLEFATFLNQHNMSSEISLSITDVNAIKYIENITDNFEKFISRLDDLLKKYNLRAKSSSNVEDSEFGIWAKNKTGSVWLGFYQYDNHNELQLGIEFRILKDSVPPELQLMFSKDKWINYIHKEDTCWYTSKDFSFFCVNGKFNSNNAFAFFETQIENLKQWL